MRVYLPLGIEDLELLAADGAVEVEHLLAASEDEEDELAALEQAAESGAVAAAAEVDAPDGPVTLDQVESFHLDIDGSGDLAWYARQEIDEVVDLLTRRG